MFIYHNSQPYNSILVLRKQSSLYSMLDTFKARLKAKAKALGVNLSQKRIDAYADRLHKKNPEITEEADHDNKVDELLELVDLKEVAKDDDKLRTLESKSKGQQDPENEEEEETEEKPGKVKKTKADEPPAWAKALLEKVTKLETEKTQQSISQRIAQSEKIKDVPAAFWNKRALPEKEEDIDTFLEDVATDYSEFEQDLTTKGLLTQTKPYLGGTTKDGISSDVATYIESKTKPEAAKSDLGGKKII